MQIEMDIGEYLQLRIEEADLRLRAVTKIVAHSTSKGRAAEEILMEVIRSFLPSRCVVTSGFVVSMGDGARVKNEQSNQVDILVYDAAKFVPLYHDKGLAVLTSETPRMAFESKIDLKKNTLKEAIQNIQSIKSQRKTISCAIWAYRGMGSETLENHLKEILRGVPCDEWPDYLFNLDRGYVAIHSAEKSNRRDWLMLSGRQIVAKTLIQGVLYSGEVENLWPYLDDIKPKNTRAFHIT